MARLSSIKPQLGASAPEMDTRARPDQRISVTRRSIWYHEMRARAGMALLVHSQLYPTCLVFVRKTLQHFEYRSFTAWYLQSAPGQLSAEVLSARHSEFLQLKKAR